MPRTKKETYAIVSPKSDAAEKKLEYHGKKWVFREMTTAVKFSRDMGPWFVLISKDGKKCMYVKKTGDPDFDIRMAD